MGHPLIGVLPQEIRFLAVYAEAVLREAERLGLMREGRHWSLAELQAWDAIGKYLYRRVQAAVFAWENLSRWRGEVAGVNLSASEALGLAMLSHCAWVGRQRGDPGEIWLSVWESLGSPARQCWFQSEGIVRASVRDAIRIACIRLRLRSSFDGDNVDQQTWVRTIQLQYGFSWNWEYLSQYHRPVIAADLVDRASPNYAPEFERLWDHLLKYQASLITEETLRHVLDKNPWLPADGIDGLIARARSRPANRSEIGGAQSRSGVFNEPELRWSGVEPHFHLRLSESLSDLLSENDYLLRVGNRTVFLKRGPDNAFRMGVGPASRDDCEIGLDEQVVSVSIERGGEVALIDQITLAPDNGLATVFSAQSGKVQEFYRLPSLKSGYLILCRKELTVSPEIEDLRWTTFGRDYRVILVPGALPSGFGIFFAAEKIWPAAERDAETYALRQVLARCSGGFWGDDSKVQLSGIPKGVEPLRFAFGREEFPIAQDAEGKYFVAPFPLDPMLIYGVREPRVRVRAWSEGEQRTYDCLWAPPAIEGALITIDGVWKPLRRRTDRRAFEGASISTRWPDSDGYLANGHHICGIFDGGRFRFTGSVSGWGEELCAIRGLSTPRSRVRLTECVYDCAELTHVDPDRESKRIRLTLAHQIEPSPEHAVWVWEDGRAEPERAEIRGAEGRQWVVEGSARTRDQMAWAVSHNGVRLGSRWRGERAEAGLAKLIASHPDWAALARWLRWFKAPIAAGAVAETVRKRVSQAPLETLSAWLLDDDELPGRAYSAVVGDRDAALLVREYLWDWSPDCDQAAAALTELSIVPADHILAFTRGPGQLSAVLDASPLLLVAMVYWGLGQLFYAAEPKFLSPVCCKLRNQCSFGDQAGASNRITDVSWSERQHDLLRAAARELPGVSAQYLGGNPLVDTARKIVKREPCDPVHHESLWLALTSDSYRRWLAARLLNDFYGILKG